MEDRFRLGIDPMPDWWMNAMSVNAVTTHNYDGRWSCGPDYALVGDKKVSFGEYVERKDMP